MARLDVIIRGTGETPSWPGTVNPRSSTVAVGGPVAAVGDVGSTSIVSAPTTPTKAASGLVIRGEQEVDTTAYANNNPTDHVFLKVAWSSISPNTNPAAGGTYNWSIIDNALTALAPSNGKITLRIQAGDTAPGWLKTATGTVQCYNSSRNVTVYPCKWWTTTARQAWQHMINAAGARYDGNHRVSMVSADLVMVVYSEPYILGNDPASGVRLYNAGLTSAAQQVQAIKDNVADTMAAFPNTLVELAMHGDLQYPTPSGVSASWPIGRQLALDLATTYGARLCLTDYGLGWDDNLSAHTPTGTLTTEPDAYAWMYLRRTTPGVTQGPIGFQATLKKGRSGLGLVQQDYIDFCNAAISLKGQHAETASFGTMTQQQRADADAALKANQF